MDMDGPSLSRISTGAGRSPRSMSSRGSEVASREDLGGYPRVTATGDSGSRECGRFARIGTSRPGRVVHRETSAELAGVRSVLIPLGMGCRLERLSEFQEGSVREVP